MAVRLRSPARSPSPPSQLSPHGLVRIRHPAYQTHNLLLSFPSWDVIHSEDDRDVYGVSFSTVHTACAIIANNRFDGWLSRDRQGQDRVQLGSQALLEAGDYFFHVPTLDVNQETFNIASSSSTSAAASALSVLQRYPVVPTFRQWKFPGTIPPSFAAIVGAGQPLTSARYSAMEVVHSRDRYCLLTAATDALESARLVPGSEDAWFLQNDMAEYADSIPAYQSAIDSECNAILLCKCVHTLYDRSNFTIVPKQRETGEWAPTIHVLGAKAGHIHRMYHNKQLRTMRGICPEYLFARFAWDVFPHLLRFLDAGATRRLAVHDNNGSVRVDEFSAADCKRMTQYQGPGRSSSSPKKRKEADAADVDDNLSHSDDSDSANISPDSGVAGFHRGTKRPRTDHSNEDGTREPSRGRKLHRDDYQHSFLPHLPRNPNS